jgi:hypothetical protein
MAAKAASYKFKAAKTYTVAPFGRHAMALFWAHLCAAGKKPIPNFILPLIAGLAVGGLGATAMRSMIVGLNTATRGHIPRAESESLGYTVLGLMVFYLWQGFMTTSRTASESSIRRRELVAPLPISGWQSVAADLGVPFCAVLICFVTCGVTYIAFGGISAALVLVGFALALPMRIAGRMVLQHLVVLAYPDLTDKMQRLLSMFIGAIIGLPFLIAEGVVCLPGLFLHSVWLALIPLTLIQIPLSALFLYMAGRATERAIATGEPVNILRLFKATA